jgi:hypothetical protein
MKTKKEYTAFNDDEVKMMDEKIRAGLVAGEFIGEDIAFHFISLANSAFATGRAVFVAALNGWILNPPKDDTLHRAWALYSLLRTGFWLAAQTAIFKLLESDNGPKVLDLLVVGNRIAPDNTLMELALPQDRLKKWREFLGNQTPWIPKDRQVAEVKEIFSSYIAQLSVTSQGGWDATVSEKSQSLRALGKTVLDAIELKPGMFGFRLDLKKLGNFWKKD